MHHLDAQGTRGFVLIAAIMIVLVISALGASLLANGPLESSLVIDSSNGMQAFYRAEQGISRGTGALRSLANLSEVDGARPGSMGTDVVPYVRAWQLRSGGNWDSTAALQLVGPDAGPIRLRAQGRASGPAGFPST